MQKAALNRCVEFHPGAGSPGVKHNAMVPFAAAIVYVWNDDLVNLVYYDHNGQTYTATSVPLVPEGADPPPAGTMHCTWPVRDVPPTDVASTGTTPGADSPG